MVNKEHSRPGGDPNEELLIMGFLDTVRQRGEGMSPALALGQGFLDQGRALLTNVNTEYFGKTLPNVSIPPNPNYFLSDMPDDLRGRTLEGLGLVLVGATVTSLSTARDKNNGMFNIHNYNLFFNASIKGTPIPSVLLGVPPLEKEIIRIKKLLEGDGNCMLVPFFNNLNLLPDVVRLHLSAMNKEINDYVKKAADLYVRVAQRVINMQNANKSSFSDRQAPVQPPHGEQAPIDERQRRSEFLAAVNRYLEDGIPMDYDWKGAPALQYTKYYRSLERDIISPKKPADGTNPVPLEDRGLAGGKTEIPAAFANALKDLDL